MVAAALVECGGMRIRHRHLVTYVVWATAPDLPPDDVNSSLSRHNVLGNLETIHDAGGAFYALTERGRGWCAAMGVENAEIEGYRARSACVVPRCRPEERMDRLTANRHELAWEHISTAWLSGPWDIASAAYDVGAAGILDPERTRSLITLSRDMMASIDQLEHALCPLGNDGPDIAKRSFDSYLAWFEGAFARCTSIEPQLRMDTVYANSVAIGHIAESLMVDHPEHDPKPLPPLPLPPRLCADVGVSDNVETAALAS